MLLAVFKSISWAVKGKKAFCEPSLSGQRFSKERSDQDHEIIDWTDYFMAIARLSAMRSKDKQTQVGACIVNQHKRIVATGYNGMVELPDGKNDEMYDWDEERKHNYVCHAEMNAVLNRNTTDLKGCTVYVTLFPCKECAKILIQAGIRRVFYISDRENETFKISREMLTLADISIREFKPRKPEICVDLKKEVKGKMNN